MTAIQDTAREIADRTRVTITIAEKLGVTVTTEQALAIVIDGLKRDATDARNRGGWWRYESTTEQIDAVLFAGSIAEDVRANTFRPSTGPVGDYVRSLLEA